MDLLRIGCYDRTPIKGILMSRILKATVGIRTQTRMFRIRGLGGTIVDAVLQRRGHASLPEDAFAQVGFIADEQGIRLGVPDHGPQLTVTHSDITYQEDCYTEGLFDFARFHQRFRELWKTVNEILKVTHVRRIGFVTEERLENPNPSEALLESLTKWPSQSPVAGFNLRFVERVSESPSFNEEESAYVNRIYSLYDGLLDKEHPDQGQVNAMLDIQRYFAPLISGNMADELLKLHNKDYLPAHKELKARLATLGLK